MRGEQGRPGIMSGTLPLQSRTGARLREWWHLASVTVEKQGWLKQSAPHPEGVARPSTSFSVCMHANRRQHSRQSHWHPLAFCTATACLLACPVRPHLRDKAHAVNAAHGDGSQASALGCFEGILHLVEPPLGREDGAA